MRTPPLPLLVLLSGCTAAEYAAEADRQVYGILEKATHAVTGEAKTYPIDRPENTLRQRLSESPATVTLDLKTALDVAAENSREYQRQKEQLYLVALSLTRQQHEFAIRWGAGGSAAVAGVGDDEVDVSFREDLAASVNTVSGGRIVFGFVNSLLRSVLTGGGFDGASILNMAITQPLLAGAGPEIAMEPLTQAERDVVYQVRSFEHFRAALAIDVLSDYLGIAQQMANIGSERANLESVRKSREQIDALFQAGRRSIDDIDRARQNELSAEDRLVNSQNRLQASLDAFKIRLGLPVDGDVQLDPKELDRLREIAIEPVDLAEPRAIELALARRYEYRTALDEVEDASRQIVVAESALQSVLDFSAAFAVPSEPGKPFKLDWSRVEWSAGFDLDLALDRLAERNVYRTALINLDVAIRNRELAEDQIKQQIRNELRDIQSRIQNYKIQEEAVKLAERREDSATELYLAARAQALDVLDAQDALLVARLSLTAARVDYAIARLDLLLDLEAVALEPKGLRFDMALPLPEGPAEAAPVPRSKP